MRDVGLPVSRAGEVKPFGLMASGTGASRHASTKRA
jgi:hypothetical protein